MKKICLGLVLFGVMSAEAAVERSVKTVIACEMTAPQQSMEVAVVQDRQSPSGLTLLVLQKDGRSGSLRVLTQKHVSELSRYQTTIYRDDAQSVYLHITRQHPKVSADLSAQISNYAPVELKALKCSYDSEIKFLE